MNSSGGTLSHLIRPHALIAAHANLVLPLHLGSCVRFKMFQLTMTLPYAGYCLPTAPSGAPSIFETVVFLSCDQLQTPPIFMPSSRMVP
jgi:hypothetical protein